MNILILGGNSKRHYDWVREAQAALAPRCDEARVLDYKHWETGEELADIEHEIAAAGALVADWDEYAVVAKSVGTVIATLAHARGSLQAKTYVLLGIPYTGIAGETSDFEPSLGTLPHTVVVQNKHDPFGVAADVRERIDAVGMQDVTFIQTPGDSHDYLDFDLVAGQLG